MKLYNKIFAKTKLWLFMAVMAVSVKQGIAQGHPAVLLRTNGLYYLAASPNIGVEIQTDLGLAWQLDYIGAWWNSATKRHFFSNYAFQTELRYYPSFGKQGFPYHGHHVGAYGQLATYDFKLGKKGLLCRDLDKSFGVGLSYGYTQRLNRRLSLDFTIGLGYFHTEYMKYEDDEEMDGYVRTDTRKLNFFGPTKAEIALVWNIKIPKYYR